MIVYPIKFEAYGSDNEPLFKVENEDGNVATVTISTAVTVELWGEISAAIKKCLIDMKLGE